MEAAVFLKLNGGTAIYVGCEPTFRKDDAAANNESAIHMVHRGKTVMHAGNILDVVHGAWACDRRGGQGASFVDHSKTEPSEMDSPLLDSKGGDGSLEFYIVEESKLDDGKCMREFRPRGYSVATDRTMDLRDKQYFGFVGYKNFNMHVNRLHAITYQSGAHQIGTVSNTRMFKGPHYEVIERPAANVMGPTLTNTLINYLAEDAMAEADVERLERSLSLLDWDVSVSAQIAGQDVFPTGNIHDCDARVNRSSYSMGYTVGATRHP
jgi:hypothetical protein